MTYTNVVDIQELISGKGFIMVNKGLAKMVGLVPATIYGELVSTCQYWKDRNLLTEIDGKEWFFCTLEDLEDKTTIKKDAQAKAIKTLEKEGLIVTKRHGLPAKRYFHLTDKYVQLLVDNYFTGKPQTDSTNDSGDANGQKPRSNQITGKPQTTLLENRKQDSCKTATNKKALNNKSLNNLKHEKDIYIHTSNELNEPEKMKDAEIYESRLSENEKILHKQIHSMYEHNPTITEQASLVILRANNTGKLSRGAVLRSLLKVDSAIREGVQVDSVLSYFEKVYTVELKTDELIHDVSIQDAPAIAEATNKVDFYNWLEERE